jgi:teichuronic acid exporter
MRNGRGAKSILGWAGVESVFLSLISIASLLLVVRLVGATSFGEASLAIALVSLVEVAFSFGLLEALIRHRSADTRISDTAFWTRLGLGVLAFLFCVAVSGAVGKLYGPQLEGLFLAYAITTILNALNEVPSAILIRKFRTRKLALITIVARSATLLATVALALAGYGAWSLIVGAILGALVTNFLLWGMASRLPRLQLDMREAGGLMKFGVVVAMDTLLWTMATRLFLSLFGYFHGAQALGYLNLAIKLIDESGAIISRISWKIGYPMLARAQRDGKSVKKQYKKANRYLCYIIVPVFAGIGVTAAHFIPLIFGSDWYPAIAITQALAFAWVLLSVRLLVPTYLKVIGRQNLLPPLSLFDALLAMFVVATTTEWQFQIVAIAWAFRVLLSIPVEIWVLARITGFPVKDQLAPALPAFSGAIVMSLTVLWLAHDTKLGEGVAGLSQLVAAGAVTYLCVMSLIDAHFRDLLRKGTRLIRAQTGLR